MIRNRFKWLVFSLSLTSVTVLTEMRVAIMRPPMTARPVQSAWPRMPPTQTPYTSSRAARITVASWDRSPHSARVVIVKAWMKILLNIENAVTSDL